MKDGCSEDLQARHKRQGRPLYPWLSVALWHLWHLCAHKFSLLGIQQIEHSLIGSPLSRLVGLQNRNLRPPSNSGNGEVQVSIGAEKPTDGRRVVWRTNGEGEGCLRLCCIFQQSNSGWKVRQSWAGKLDLAVEARQPIDVVLMLRLEPLIAYITHTQTDIQTDTQATTQRALSDLLTQ